ncbi:putative conserved secreted protein [Alloalcanivorax dieselolei B5]|uniref:Putative conserved secreted protein n=1 Tax=Alcanivorax dieselolei (strain DSM 16502 / CGMCC 1.3690 / MCCC 1A00001 / B-5) TaxID=930169 RepID=K0CDC9_ALCDB|nr:hypothetical protein [Alloalcanivorax dieselolei]AFT69571.1 putative conserved secreted protein [Alloalcanivorax dieselolei B5]GGK04112.1 hypothetical protein GCM10007426_36300 [Alloalcanivorax dieselolei]
MKKPLIALSGIAIAAALFFLIIPNDESPDIQALTDAMLEKKDARLSRLESVEDEALRKSLRNLVYDAMFTDGMELDFQAPPRNTAYTTAKLARLDDYSSIDELTEVFLANQIAATTYRDRSCVWPREPFDYPFQHQLAWTAIRLDNGETTELPNHFSGSSYNAEIEYSGARSTFCYRDPLGPDEPAPVALVGEFSVQLPQKLIQFDFSRPDVDQSQSKDGYTVTLVEANDFSYAIEVSSSSGEPPSLGSKDIIGEALDDTGKYLAHTGTRTGRAELYEASDLIIDGLIDRALEGTLTETQIDQRFDEMQGELNEKYANKLHKHFFFSGSVKTARITVLDKEAKQTPFKQRLDLPIRNLARRQPTPSVDLDTLERIPTLRPVYDHSIQSKVDLNADEMKTAIDIRQNEISADLKYSAQVKLYYPPVQSDRFLDIFDRYQKPGADDIVFLNAQGAPIDVPSDDPDYYRFMVSRIEYNPDRFPEKPVRLSATVPVVTTPNLTPKGHGRNNLPDGVRIMDNMVVIDRAVFKPASNNERSEKTYLFFAKSADQRYLSKVTGLHFPRTEGPGVDVIYYNGSPEIFEVWYRGDKKIVEYQVELDLEEPAPRE